MAELWRKVGATSGARGYSLAAGAVSLVITARVLGPEGRGFVATAVTWSLLFSTIGYLSLGQVALHRAAGREPAHWLGETFGALLLIAALVTALGWIVAAVLYVASDGAIFGHIPGHVLALGFLTLPFLVWEQYGSSLLMAVGRLSVYNRAEVVGRTIQVGLIVVLVVLADAGVSGALVALVIGQAIVAGVGVRYLLDRAGNTLALRRTTVRELLSGGVKLHLNAVGTFLFVNASVIVVQGLRGSAETGMFQVAVQLMNVALVIPTAASMVIYAEVAKLGPAAAWPSNRRLLLGLTGLMTAIAALAILLAPTLLPLIVGDDFKPAVPVFQIFALTLIGQTFSAVMAPQWIGRGLFWQASVITVALGLTNLAATFPLVDAYGMKGAAYGLLCVYTISMVGNGIFAVWVGRRSADAT